MEGQRLWLRKEGTRRQRNKLLFTSNEGEQDIEATSLDHGVDHGVTWQGTTVLKPCIHRTQDDHLNGTSQCGLVLTYADVTMWPSSYLC